MKNVYDLRYENQLIFLLSENQCMVSAERLLTAYKKTAVIVYLYYTDTLSTYYPYLDHIPSQIDLYVISSKEKVLREIKEYMHSSLRKQPQYILKENRGRDVSALLVTGREIVKNYEYVCFLHDKKEHRREVRDDIRLWNKNLWGNQIGSTAYIGNVLGLFEREKELGILVPPEPIGRHFNTWYGCGWDQSFETTVRIARRLRLKADISSSKPPVTFGTVLWFKTSALGKLFDAGWKYSDFNDEGLKQGDYLSYAIERIFAYVAQDAGYTAGTIMSISYAERQMNFLQYTTSLIFREADMFFPINRMDDLECYKRNKSRIIQFAKKKTFVYLYGAGKMGRLCAAVLRAENIRPAGFVVSKKSGADIVDCIPVIGIEEVKSMEDAAVIITAYDGRVQNEMAEMLEMNGWCNYIRFWEH